MRNNLKYLIETYNGEGYSNPKIIKVNSKKELNKKFKGLLEEYPVKDFEYTHNCSYGVTFDNGTDQGAIQLIEVPDDKYTLLQVMPDINEVAVLDSSSDLNKMLLLLEETAEENNFEDDDMAEYVNGVENILSSHGDNGFYHLQII